MNIFFIQGVGNIDFIDKKEFEENIKKLGIDKKIIDIFGLKGVYINKKYIKDILPLINGMFGKYYFIDSSSLDDDIILGKNIFDIKYNGKEIKDIENKIEYIKKEINSDKLITRSKKEEYTNTIKENIYVISSFLIKTYFLLTSAIENKEELKKIINNRSSPEEFKANAYLINEIGFNKIELLSTRFEITSEQLKYFSSIMKECFKKYIK